MKVTIKTLDSNTKEYDLPSNIVTIADLKHHIANDMNIEENNQRMIFKGKVLNNNSNLTDIGVDGNTIHLVKKPATSSSNNQSTSNSNERSHTVFIGRFQPTVVTSSSSATNSLNSVQVRLQSLRRFINQAAESYRTLRVNHTPSLDFDNFSATNSERNDYDNLDNSVSLLSRLFGRIQSELSHYREIIQSSANNLHNIDDVTYLNQFHQILHHLSHGLHAMSELTFRAEQSAENNNSNEEVLNNGQNRGSLHFMNDNAENTANINDIDSHVRNIFGSVLNSLNIPGSNLSASSVSSSVVTDQDTNLTNNTPNISANVTSSATPTPTPNLTFQQSDVNNLRDNIDPLLPCGTFLSIGSRRYPIATSINIVSLETTPTAIRRSTTPPTNSTSTTRIVSQDSRPTNVRRRPVIPTTTTNTFQTTSGNQNSSSTSTATATSSNRQTLTSDSDWKSNVPREWISTIEKDTEAQMAIKTTDDYNQAYICGMPSKRRKELLEKNKKNDYQTNSDLD